MGKKLLAIVLSLALVLGSIGMAFGETAQDPTFADMPDNWSTAALNKAVENQLLKGYEEGGKMLIKADNPLTRAEMAAVVNRAFASSAEADISKVTDVAATAWYAKDMAKAVKMGTFALDTKMRPGDKITRQEAFAVLARAFKLASTDTDYKALNKFSDKADIAAWALKDLDGMAAAGYIQGSGGKLNPTANITRAEFAVVMDNLVKQYIDEAGTVTEVVASGNVMVRVPGVTLQNVTVKGDLVIADGVGEGNVTLDNVKVEGRTVVRGGGENSIIIKGNSDLGRVIVTKVDGKVRISVEGNADVEIIYVDDGSDDVLVEGTIGTLEVAGSDVTVTATGATLTSGIVSGDNSRIVLGAGSTLKDGAISGSSSGITVNEGATVEKVTVSGSNAALEGKGTLKNVEVVAGGNNASITTPNTVTSVGSGVEGVKAGGVEVPAGSTATNNATGTDATVKEPSTGGGGGGGGPTRHLTLNGNNIDDLDGQALNTSLFNLVTLATQNALYGDNIDKFDNLNFTDFKDKFIGVFLPLATATKENLDSKLQQVATNITQTPDRYVVVAQAKTISSNISNIADVTYTVGVVVKTLKSITVEACGETCVVFTDGDGKTLGDFEALYDAVKGKTLREIAQAGTAKVTIVINDGTANQTKVLELKYE